MAKAVGVGGVFLKARDPLALSKWYAEHLGIPAQDGGSLAFDGPESAGMTVFAHFPAATKYCGEGAQQVMGASPGSGIRKAIAWSSGSRCSWTAPIVAARAAGLCLVLAGRAAMSPVRTRP